jgi:glyoxylase-like metal-dependent hydrolase (beta-lactamase superfamily II)/rhodanese-related sulfurtransferase
MYFKQFLDERYGCASYVVEPYEALLRERDFQLRYVIETHVHADHLSGARQLAATHGASVCLYESAQVAYPYRPLRDGEELALGQLRLRVWHTPGHRPELISILIINPVRSSQPSMVLTGDSLLVGDVGRPDFGGGDAAAQFESLRRLLRLPDWVAVFPGHFEGSCGKGMCGRPSTTIGFERLYNPLVHLERPAFLAAITIDVPARPLNMTVIEATNRGVAQVSWAMLTTVPVVPELDVDTLASASAEMLVLDVREPEEYAQGHVPGAINLPQADLASRLDELPRDSPLALICRSGARSLRAAQFLRQVGFEQVTDVQGGTQAWRAAGKPLVKGLHSADKPQSRDGGESHGREQAVGSPADAVTDQAPLLSKSIFR